MAGGLLDQLGFATAVVFALPVALLGLIRLTNGDAILGAVLFGIAVGMVAIEEFVLSPREIVLGMLWGGDGEDDDRAEES